MRILFYVSLSLFFVISASSIAYYFIMFLPQKELIQLELQKTVQKEKGIAAEQKAKDLKACLMMADLNGVHFWNNECKSQGLGEECRLPTYNANRVDGSIKEDKEDCFKQYPQ